MYEQYVFEMEEQGLQPMSFSEFLAQARAGMADGGRIGFTKGGDVMKAVNRGIDPAEALDLLKEYKRMKERFGYLGIQIVLSISLSGCVQGSRKKERLVKGLI